MTVLQTNEVILDNVSEKRVIEEFLHSPDYEFLGCSKTSSIFRNQKVFSNVKSFDRGKS